MVIPKTLYKVTAYHCPRCGGITNPNKKYCEYCERELLDNKMFVKQKPEFRILVEGNNGLVNFNGIRSFNIEQEPIAIDTTSFNSIWKKYVPGIADYSSTLNLEMPLTERVAELVYWAKRGIRKIRFEVKHGDFAQALEAQSYLLSDGIMTGNPGEIVTAEFGFQILGDVEVFNDVIPKHILNTMTCPNCGAPIRSRLGTCDYCGGWNEVEWR